MEPADSYSLENFQVVMKAALSGVVITDDHGVIKVFNRTSEKMFGYTQAEAVGQSIRILMPSQEQDKHEGAMKRYLRTGEAHVIGREREVTALRKDGSTFPCLLALGEGVALGKTIFVAIMRDLSEIKDAEAKRDALIKRLTETNDELHHFVRAVSHDLQHPLRMIMSFGERLNKEYHDDLAYSGQVYMEEILKAVRGMRDLLSDLSDYNVLDGHQRSALTDINHCFADAVRNLQNTIAQTGAKVTAEGLPTLTINRVRFSMLLQNLIGNALKYVEPGTVPIIHVTGTRKNNYWRFDIKDNGIGIEERHLERIFVPFQRLHNDEEYPGTGLGLAICKKVVDALEGEIWATSHPGEGSVFSFTVKDIARP